MKGPVPLCICEDPSCVWNTRSLYDGLSVPLDMMERGEAVIAMEQAWNLRPVPLSQVTKQARSLIEQAEHTANMAAILLARVTDMGVMTMEYQVNDMLADYARRVSLVYEAAAMMCIAARIVFSGRGAKPLSKAVKAVPGTEELERELIWLEQYLRMETCACASTHYLIPANREYPSKTLCPTCHDARYYYCSVECLSLHECDFSATSLTDIWALD